MMARCTLCVVSITRYSPVKPPLPKSLVFSFFLIGIILGMVLINANVIDLPQPESKPVEAGKTGETQKPRKSVVRSKAPSASRSTAKSTPRKEPVAEQPEADKFSTEPVICDRKEAIAVRKKAQEIAVIMVQGKELNITLGDAWAYYSPGIRRSFVERFAASDTCLHGIPRPIHFFYHGEEVASTDIHGGVELK